VALSLCKERLQGEIKQLKPLRYEPFYITEQVSKNTFRLKLPPYMQINSVVNVENLKLFEPSMLDEEEEHQVLPTIEDLEPHGNEELKEDIVMQHKEQTTRKGQQKMWQIGLKGQTTNETLR
jgi:hypothetical protein